MIQLISRWSEWDVWYCLFDSFAESSQFRVEMVVFGYDLQSECLQGGELLLLNHIITFQSINSNLIIIKVHIIQYINSIIKNQTHNSFSSYLPIYRQQSAPQPVHSPHVIFVPIRINIFLYNNRIPLIGEKIYIFLAQTSVPLFEPQSLINMLLWW